MHKMKILHTESSCGWGGQEIRILEESQGLIQRGHDVRLICPHESHIYKEAARYNVPAIALPIDHKSLKGLFVLKSWITDNHIDVINTHSSTDSWLTALACKLSSCTIPIVRTRHISAPITNNWYNRWLYVKMSTHVVTTGEAIKNHIISTMMMPSNKVTSIPTGIDPTRFKPSDKKTAKIKLGLDPKIKYIGIVATLRSWKGHSYLIDAFSKINSPNWKLIIVGDGPQKENIENQIIRLKISDKIITASQQNNPEKWMQALDIFCLPSYANEGIPQSIIQAMFSKLAIITTSVGAIPEAITDKETGIIIPIKDSKSLWKAIYSLMLSNSLRSELGAKAQQSAQQFTKEIMLNSMENLFRTLS